LTENMCTKGKEGYFSNISKRFGTRYVKLMKDWIHYNFKLCKVKQQRRFLVRCRSWDILPPHIYNLKIGVTLHGLRYSKIL